MLNFPNLLAAAAIAGAAIAYLLQRRSGRRTLATMRAELRQDQAFLRTAVEALPAALGLAKQRLLVEAEAAGPAMPEELRKRLVELAGDCSRAALMLSQLPAANADYSRLSADELDICLIDSLALSIRAQDLADKYRPAPSARSTAGRTLEPRLDLAPTLGMRQSG